MEELEEMRKLLRERDVALQAKDRELEGLRTRLLAKQTNTSSHNNTSPQPSDVLRLNIGGTRVDVLRRTLTQVEGSMLASKFSGRWDETLERDQDGAMFIDQPSELMVPMLNYLRARQIETPVAPPVSPPEFANPKDLADLYRIVEYYGLTLAMYPIGVYCINSQDPTGQAGLVGEGLCQIASSPGEWTTVCLQPKYFGHARGVASYEVVLHEPCTGAQLGWVHKLSSWDRRSLSAGYGVGYLTRSIGLDCVRSALVINGTSTALKEGSGVSVAPGTTIRLEDSGSRWLVNGTPVASIKKKGGDTKGIAIKFDNFGADQWIPCLTIQGSCQITALELKY